MKTVIKRILYAARAFWLRGDKFYCPLCGKRFRAFLPFGNPRRMNALCPECRSLERHRLLWVAMQKVWSEGFCAKNGRILHVAPEPVLEEKFRKQFDYMSIDLDGKKAMQAMDVTDLKFADESFDAVVCNHVLEHVLDDRKALSEFFRVLKPGGWGLIQVPMQGETTYEDPDVTDSAERERLFGQSDHVRRYGHDYLARVKEAGFTIQVFPKQDLLKANELERLSVNGEHSVILSLKPLEFSR